MGEGRGGEGKLENNGECLKEFIVILGFSAWWG